MVLFFPPPPDSSSSEDDDDDVVEPVKVTNHALKKIIVQLSHRLAGTGHTMGLDAFRGVVGDCGYLLPASTLQRWRKSIKKDPAFFDSPVSHGRWPSLTSDEEAMLVGWILHEGAMKRQVTYAGCQEFLDQQFGIKLTQPTLRRISMQILFQTLLRRSDLRPRHIPTPRRWTWASNSFKNSRPPGFTCNHLQMCAHLM